MTIIDKDALYGRTVVYDGIEEAEEIAAKTGGIAKHSTMKQPHPFKTFSVVVVPSEKNHLSKQKG